MRVVHEDHVVAQNLGINVKRIFQYSWIISCVIAAIVGMLLGNIQGVGLALDANGLIALRRCPFRRIRILCRGNHCRSCHRHPSDVDDHLYRTPSTRRNHDDDPLRFLATDPFYKTLWSFWFSQNREVINDEYQ